MRFLLDSVFLFFGAFFRHVNVCAYVCGQIAFVLGPQANTQMSVSRVELMQVTNARTGEALFTVATQSCKQ